MGKIGELQSIALLTSHVPQAPLPYGVGDDCALIENDDSNHVVTMDSMAEGIHFDEGWKPSDVGWKLIASNVSDIVSMGRRPSYCTCSISLPSDKRNSWLPLFRKGFVDALKYWGIHLVGGDMTGSQHDIFLSLTLHSTTETVSTDYPKAIFRCGAKIGDEVYVTGNIGNAAAFYFRGTSQYIRPTPPVDFAVELREQNLVSSMMDISDGISQDIEILCERSDVFADIFEEMIPYDSSNWENFSTQKPPTAWLTSFGEDFELLFTSSPSNKQHLQQISQKHGVKLTRIGVIKEKGKEEQRIQLYRHGTKIPFPQSLFQHFS